MKPGQRLTRWWQKLVAGRVTAPRELYQMALNEAPDPALAYTRFQGIPDDDNWRAPERLKAPNFMRTESFLRQWDRADWQHVDPRLMKWSAMVIERARRRNIPLYVHSAFRTEAEQHQLVQRGVSRTRYPTSAHNIGEAVDLVHGVYHWDLTRQEWDLIRVLGELALDRLNATLPADEKLELEWGGHWRKPWDPAHWQIKGYQARTRHLPVQQPVRYTPRRMLRL